MPAPRRPRMRGAKTEERNMRAKSGGKGSAEIIEEREAGRDSKRKWAQVTIIGPGHDVARQLTSHAETFETVICN